MKPRTHRVFPSIRHASILLGMRLTIVLMFCFSAAHPQHCNSNELLLTPGKWKAGMKGSVAGIAPSDLQRQQAVLGKIVDMIREGYTPRGINVDYSLVHSPSPLKYPNKVPIGNSYHLSLFLMPLDCVNGKIEQHHETPSSVNIFVNAADVGYESIFPNSFSYFIPKDKEDEDDRSDVYGLISKSEKPVLKDGVWRSSSSFTGGFQVVITRVMYFVTKNNELPIVFVNRKEYAEKLKKYIAEKYAIDLNFFGKNPESNKEIIKNLQQRYKELNSALEEILKSSESYLNKPATISSATSFGDFKGFVDEDHPDCQWVIRPDPKYWDGKLPRSQPQSFTVRYEIAEQVEVFNQAYRDLHKAIDFSMLRSLLTQPVSTVSNLPVKSKPAAKSATNTAKPANQAAQKQNIEANDKTVAVPKFDIYQNRPTKGFSQTATAQIRNAAVKPVIDSRVKAKAMAVTITQSNRHEYLKKLLSDIESQMTEQQKKRSSALLDSAGNDVEGLANMGVFIYLKGVLNEGLWCLAKAAVIKPQSDYIMNNLTGIMVMCGASPRALPMARYLASKYPRNTTVMNNLGQAWYALDELMKSKQALDTVMLYAVYHPEANATRAAIAEREGKNDESVKYIIRSLKGAYNPSVEDFARKKGVRLDYANMINRRRPFEAEYINPMDFRPPPQCTNVSQAAELEAEWKAWKDQVNNVTDKISAGLEAAEANFDKMVADTKNEPGISVGFLNRKADILYKIYLEELGGISREAGEYLKNNYEKSRASIESDHESAFARINEKNKGGDGVGISKEQICREVDVENNIYLENMAALNNDFNARFSEPIRRLSIELMFWSQFLSEPVELRELKYYERALFAVNPLMMHSEFAYPCVSPPKMNKQKEMELPEPYCPISFKFKVVVVKLTGDCGKFEVEISLPGGLLLGIERDFVNRKSTLAFGVGVDIEVGGFAKEDDPVGFIEDAIPELINGSGAGFGGKTQWFIECGPDGAVSDIGIRAEASLEGAWTEKGDVKIGGKLGVNSGVEITGSEAVRPIVDHINKN